MSRLDDIKGRAEKFANLCPDYVYRAIRHVERNCDIECAREELDENHDCIRPDRYDGEAMAVALSDLAALVAVVEGALSHADAEVKDYQARGSAMSEHDQIEAAGRATYAEELIERLRPLTGEGKK